MANRTTRRAFDKRTRSLKVGIYTLLLVAALVGALVISTVALPPQIAAWRSRRSTEEARALAAQNKVFEAMALLEYAVALDPGNEVAQFNLGVLELAVNGDAVAASDRFRRATEAEADFARAYYNLGVVQLFYLYKPRVAADNFKKALEIRGDYAAAYAGLGLAYEALGEYGAARDAYERYAEQSPDGLWAELVEQHKRAIGGLPAVDDLAARMRSGDDDAFEMVAVGDMSLARGVNVDLYTGRSESPLRFVAPLIGRAQVAFGNLESPLTKRAKRAPTKGPRGGSIYLKGNPDYAFILTEAGFDVLSLANNHAMDYGEQGLSDTIYYLDQEEIKHVGAGPDLAAALAPADVDLDGFVVRFLAFNGVEPREYSAGAGKAGTAPLDEGTVTSAIARAKAGANLVVVSLHWGGESMAYPSSEQKRLAHRFVDAGADVILGHHPHVIQSVETYEGAVIAYSLGNFLFDSRFPKRHYSTLLAIEVSRSRGILGFRLIPIYIEGTEPAVSDEKDVRDFMDFALLSGSGESVRVKPPEPSLRRAVPGE
jgi:poly-gamma-glutamate capsule biosynthesis protein CapA/YwtB (metallophosphatase superfamily)/Tfp pilus assembly protein PilF